MYVKSQSKNLPTLIVTTFQSMVVACKTYRNENKTQEFHKEVQNLEFLREAFKGSKRVMTHIAAIVHGNNLMILLPRADLGDLETFLHRGKRVLDKSTEFKRVYDFDEKFPELAEDRKLHSTLLRELFEISSALVWLHEELYLYDRLDYYLAHMDLKPENILVIEESGYAGGIWKLSDFGVSLFDRATNEKASRYHSIRDVGPRLTSKANPDQIIRGRGPYEPPEVDLSNVDGRKCDVWSFSCILCDVLAFACGGEEELNEFRKTRYDGKNDYFYRTVESKEDRSRIVTSSNTQLKSEIREWFGNLVRRFHFGWVRDYVAVLEKALIPDPTKRVINMRGIMQVLEKLPPRMRSEPIHPVDTPPCSSLSRSNVQLVPDVSACYEQALNVRSGYRQSSNDTFRPKGSNKEDHLVAPMSNSRFPTGYDPTNFPPIITIERPSNGDRAWRSDSHINNETSQQQSAQADSNHLSASSHVLSDDINTHSRFEAVVNNGAAIPSATAYEAWPKILTSRNKKGRATSIALSPGGNQVAFLYGHQVRSYLTEDGSMSGSTVELPSTVTWKRIALSPPFLAAYGTASCDKSVSCAKMPNRSHIIRAARD